MSIVSRRCRRASRLVLLAATVAAMQTAGRSQTNPYRRVDGLQAGQGPGRLGVAWAKLPKGRRMGSPAGLDVDRDGESLWAAIRCGNDDTPLGSQTNCDKSDLDPIVRFDKDGNVTQMFGSKAFSWPHGLHVDSDGNLWIAEAGTPAPGARPIGHQVLKFSPEGKLLMTLGEAGVPGSDASHFNRPTDVVTARNGDIFVSDGHDANGNNRIVKFSKDGKYITSFGTTGYGPGQLRIPHALNIDPATGHIYVADRGNQRIVIFDQDGKYLNRWTQFGMPSDIVFDNMGHIYVADSESDANENTGWAKGIRVGRVKAGFVDYFIPDPADNPSITQHGSGAESLAVDRHGNIFAGEPRNHALQKYIRVW
jgi:DNA-binding beta-propeller fold protein YncE